MRILNSETKSMFLDHYCVDCGGKNFIYDWGNRPSNCLDCGGKSSAHGKTYTNILYWLKEAELYASKSKDPSTKVGAVIVDSDGILVSKGYNGFARKVKDLPSRYKDRDTKIKMVVHAETNAILFAERSRLKGSTLYTWPFMPCSNCAALVINAGISTVVAPAATEAQIERWKESFKLTEQQFHEADVTLWIVQNG